MLKFTQRLGVFALSLWMTLIVPVTACHHIHPEGETDGLKESVSTHLTGHARNTLVGPTSGVTGVGVSAPCLLCGRVLQPLPAAEKIGEALTPGSGRVIAPLRTRHFTNPVLRRLRDRSPPGSPHFS
jgi:hypothetical protein